MASTRAKAGFIPSQICVKYMGIIIFIKTNTDMNTGDMRIL